MASYTPPDFSIPEERPSAQRTTIYARDGSVLDVLGAENRQIVPLTRLPLRLRWAFLAAEDHRFYEHAGIDGVAVLRAIQENRKAGRVVQGASTITEQYVKNAYFLGEDRSSATKVREAGIAFELEKRMSKDEILEAYLNTIYLGSGAYGIEAAAETYFNRGASELTLAQGALVASLARSPEGSNPFIHPEAAVARRNTVLDQMVTYHLLDPEEAREAKAEPLGLQPTSEPPPRFPWFLDYVRRVFLDDPRYGVTAEDRAWFLYRGGLQIHTTIDPLMQAKAETATSEFLDDPNDPEVSLAAVDPSTGELLAAVGGRDYRVHRFDIATQGERQAGSAFKPFALVAAIEQGLDPLHTRLDSTPRTFLLPSGEAWSVNNYDGYGYGMVNLTEATVNSYNAAYAELAIRIGASSIVSQAHKMGIQADMDAFPSVVLGALSRGVSPLEMASAFGSLATNGVAVPPTPILSVSYSDGRVIDGHNPGHRALSPGGAWVTTQILQQVITRGTGRAADIGRPAAGKTGTTSDYADAWFSGYTPNLATAVWVGYPDGRVSMRNIHGISVAGGTYPARIWSAFMGAALDGRPAVDFRRPVEDFRAVSIDPVSHKRAQPWCRGVVIELPQVLIPRDDCPQPVRVSAVAMTDTITSTVGPSLSPTVGGEVSPTAPAPGATAPAPPPSAPPASSPTPAAPAEPGSTTTAGR